MPEVESIALGVWVNVGARFENTPQEKGIAHFLEHMSFKGTKKYSALEIAQTIENAGGSINAYTSYEKTAYYIRLLHQDLALGCNILFEVLQHSLYDPEEIEKERGVILQEIGMVQDTPDNLVFDHFQNAAFANQPLGDPILGNKESVSAMTQDDFIAFVNTHYQPSNLVVAASGKVEHQQLVDIVSHAMSHLKNIPSPPCIPASYTGGEKLEERDSQQVHIALGFPSPARSHKNHWTAAIIAQILGGGMSSRLFQEIREKRGLVYAIGASHCPYNDIGDFSIYAGTGPELISELIPVLVDEIIALAHNVSDEEIQRAKKRFQAGLLMGQESAYSRAQSHAHHVFLYGKPKHSDDIMQEINAVDKNNIKEVSQSIFSAPITLAAIGPLSNLEKTDSIQKRFLS
jgi:predicted Zn-dependent peptidase